MKKIIKKTLGFVIYVAVIYLLSFLVVHFVAQRTIVQGVSMENTLSDQDNLIVEKVTYRFHEPKRYDVIVFPYKYEKKTYLIKRIIGLPGETVYIDEEGNIYINGEYLDDPYGSERIIDAGLAGSTMYLAGDEYFVLGDNRNESMDSRDISIGAIKKKEISGRAWLRMYPFKSFGKVANIGNDD